MHMYTNSRIYMSAQKQHKQRHKQQRNNRRQQHKQHERQHEQQRLVWTLFFNILKTLRSTSFSKYAYNISTPAQRIGQLEKL